MGLTLIAVLAGALLLPGFVGVHFFYRQGRTTESDPVVPSLNTPFGISIIGGFSVLVHAIYACGLRIVSSFPPCFNWPLANPYVLLGKAVVDNGVNTSAMISLFSGLLLLMFTAMVVGTIVGQIALSASDGTVFYGPLKDILEKANGPDAWITAYVLTKIEHEGVVLGYEGNVVTITRDNERLPVKVVLKDARPFRIDSAETRDRRKEEGMVMDYLVLSSEDWHNIAFRVYLIED